MLWVQRSLNEYCLRNRRQRAQWLFDQVQSISPVDSIVPHYWTGKTEFCRGAFLRYMLPGSLTKRGTFSIRTSAQYRTKNSLWPLQRYGFVNHLSRHRLMLGGFLPTWASGSVGLCTTSLRSQEAEVNHARMSYCRVQLVAYLSPPNSDLEVNGITTRLFSSPTRQRHNDFKACPTRPITGHGDTECYSKHMDMLATIQPLRKVQGWRKRHNR